jgi:hypothetical protein
MCETGVVFLFPHARYLTYLGVITGESRCIGGVHDLLLTLDVCDHRSMLYVVNHGCLIP